MKYFLGYYNNHGYVPIKDESIGDTLMQVVDYTTSFTSIKKIKEALYNKRLIPSTNVRIDYIIEKGTKANRDYQPISSTKQIYTLESKRFFDVARLKDCLESEQRDPEFIASLCAKYIRKYRYPNHMLTYLLKQDANDLLSILKKALSISISEKNKNEIRDIIEYINSHIDNINYDVLDGMIESLINKLKNDPYDITNMYTFFKRYINFKTIPAMLYLSRWLQIVINESTNVNSDYIDSEYEIVSAVNALTSFFNEIVYIFDYTRKEYKKENGKRKIDYREFFDLAVFVEEYYRKLYEEYEEYVEAEQQRKTVVPQVTSYIEEDDKEEFLEEEDFERIGTTSEEAGYNLQRREW